MDPTNNNKWAVLRMLARPRFPEDEKVADAMHRVEELAGQHPAERRCSWQRQRWTPRLRRRRGSTLRARSSTRIPHSAQVEPGREEEWELAAAIAAKQEKEVLEVAEDAACQDVALLQA
jgi:hypothetical protein